MSNRAIVRKRRLARRIAFNGVNTIVGRHWWRIYVRFDIKSL